ncbi:hypothetical protein AB0A73_21775 [Glycomyces sp. NPDC047369]
MVRGRRSWCWLFLAAETCTTLLLAFAAAGMGGGLPMAMGALAHACMAACGIWYLRYPRAVFDPAARVLVLVLPFGLHLRERPRPAGVLVVDSERIIDASRPDRAVLRARDVRDGDWVTLTRHLDAYSGPRVRGAAVARPAFLTPVHRVWGVIWAAVLLTACATLMWSALQGTGAAAASATGTADVAVGSGLLPGAAPAPDRSGTHLAGAAAGSLR